MTRLTDTKCRNAKSREKDYKLSDGNGLYLLVTKSGGTLWKWKYRFNGIERKLSIGSYPEISLKQARAVVLEQRALLANGTDPSTEKRIKRLQAEIATATTFKAVGEEYVAKMEKEAHARYRVQKRAMRLEGLDEKAAAYAAAKQAAEGHEDDWFDLQRLIRTFVKVYADLSPDPAILEFTAEVKWAAAFLRLATQAIQKSESLDYKSYSAKIRDMLEQHVHVTGLSTTIRLRNITDPEFADDFDTGDKSETELQEAFVRKTTELRRVTRELVDKNPAQYGRFSERVLEIIRRFEEGQLAAADGLRDLEGLTGEIKSEQGAHAELGMDENAFSILRIIEAVAEETDHTVLQSAAMAIGAVYADAAATQPAFAHMEAYLRTLRQQVRRILSDHGIGETKVVREKVEEFAVHAYGGGA